MPFFRWCLRRLRHLRVSPEEPELEPAVETNSPESSPHSETSSSVEEVGPRSVRSWTIIPTQGHQADQGFTYRVQENLFPTLGHIDHDVRFYAVWRIPAEHTGTFTGTHWGVGTSACGGLLVLNDCEFRGLRFRRCETLPEARALFRTEAAAHGVDPQRASIVFGWTSLHGSPRRISGLPLAER